MSSRPVAPSPAHRPKMDLVQHRTSRWDALPEAVPARGMTMSSRPIAPSPAHRPKMDLVQARTSRM
jgi:hypothetical protein